MTVPLVRCSALPMFEGRPLLARDREYVDLIDGEVVAGPFRHRLPRAAKARNELQAKREAQASLIRVNHDRDNVNRYRRR
jgi:hypothetical protein